MHESIIVITSCFNFQRGRETSVLLLVALISLEANKLIHANSPMWLGGFIEEVYSDYTSRYYSDVSIAIQLGLSVSVNKTKNEKAFIVNKIF